MSQYTPEQLAEIERDHGLWLRDEADGQRADLSGADLRGLKRYAVNLSEAELSGADFREVDLTEADFSEADLSGADFRGADLSGADLSGADLSDADLRDADLRCAELSEADLSGAGCCVGVLGDCTAVVTTTHVHIGFVRVAVEDIQPDDDASGWSDIWDDATRWWGLYGGVVRAMIAAAQADCTAQILRGEA